MEPNKGNAFDANEKLHVLLVLYESLRWDILVRTGGMYTLVATLTVVISLIPSAFEKGFIILVPALAIVLPVFAAFFYAIHRDIEKAAARLRDLERQINGLVGEELLDWETRYGGSATGYIGRAKPL